jgi:hypothetical protein
VLAHVAGVPVEEALLAAPALLAGVTVIAGSPCTIAVDLSSGRSEGLVVAERRCRAHHRRDRLEDRLAGGRRLERQRVGVVTMPG